MYERVHRLRLPGEDDRLGETIAVHND